jgi:photosystem II stability/assembly factor-like uncharacterized protein
MRIYVRFVGIVFCLMIALAFPGCDTVDDFLPQYVAVAGQAGVPTGSGEIRVAENSTKWPDEHVTNVSFKLRAVTYYHDRFVAVGGTSNIMHSPGGLMWNNGACGPGLVLNGVAGGETGLQLQTWTAYYVAVGNNGAIIYSDDGAATWNPAVIVPVSEDYHDVAFGNAIVDNVLSPRFVAVGDTQHPGFGNAVKETIVWSPNGGSTWIEKSPGGVPNYVYFGVAFGNRRFVAVGQAGSIGYSDNGSVWYTGDTPVANALMGAAYGNLTWVAVGSDSMILYSLDLGESWQTASSPVQGLYLTDVVYGTNTLGNSKFVAIGHRTTPGYAPEDDFVVLSSDDGINWAKSAELTATSYTYQSIACKQ